MSEHEKNGKNGKNGIYDWRVWRWPGLIRKWHQLYQNMLDGYTEFVNEAQPELQRCKRLDEEVRVLRSIAGTQEHLKKAPVLPAEEAAVFAGVTDQTRWWRVLHGLLERAKGEEVGSAIAPGLAEGREYNSGRASMLYDLQTSLHQLRANAGEKAEG